MRYCVNRDCKQGYGLYPYQTNVRIGSKSYSIALCPIETRTLEKYVKESERIQLAHETAPTVLIATQKKMKLYYYVRVHAKAYKPGDTVYIHDPASRKGKYLYRINVKSAVFVTNHDKLAPCETRLLPIWLQKYCDNIQLLLDTLHKSLQLIAVSCIVCVGSLYRGIHDTV